MAEASGAGPLMRVEETELGSLGTAGVAPIHLIAGRRASKRIKGYYWAAAVYCAGEAAGMVPCSVSVCRVYTVT